MQPYTSNFIMNLWRAGEPYVIWFINNQLKITTWKSEPLCSANEQSSPLCPDTQVFYYSSNFM